MSANAELTAFQECYRHAGFFVARSPALTFGRLLTWCPGESASAALSGGESWSARRTAAVAHLRDAFSHPALQSALFFAAPALEQVVANSRQGAGLAPKLQVTLTRYLMRAAGREHPFGLFAGVSVGRVDREDCLELGAADDHRRCSLVAVSYLHRLMRDLATRTDIRDELPHELNSTLALSHGMYRFSTFNSGSSVPTRVELVHSPELERALALVGAGITPSALAQSLVDEELSDEAALELARTLCERGVLVPCWLPSATGQNHVAAALPRLRAHRALQGTAAALERAESALAEADAAKLPSAAYREVAKLLTDLAQPLNCGNPIQTVLVKAAPRLAMGQQLSDRFLAAAGLLQRTGRTREEPDLTDFRRRFQARYEQRFVPLVEALDSDIGLGFGPKRTPVNERRAGAAPRRAGTLFDTHDRARSALLQHALSAGLYTCELNDELLAAFPDPGLSNLPESFAVIARIANENGTTLVVDPLLAAPTALNTLARFCEAEPALAELVRRHAQEEQALAGDTLLADLALLPVGEVANVCARPPLRAYEIPYSGRSGAYPEQQIPFSDLYVGIENERVTLYSAKLQRRVAIRITNAHLHSAELELPAYRFLGALQAQSPGTLNARWSWGVFEDAAFLPRVVRNHVVLSLARFRFSEKELAPLRDAEGAQAFDLVQQIRLRRRLPRWLARSDDTGRLPVDLNNPLSVEELLQEIRSRRQLTLEELLPAPEQLMLHGPEGLYAAELVVPFLRREKAAQASSAALAAAVATAHVPRRHGLGSTWLYLKVYAPRWQLHSLAQSIRTEVVEPLLGVAISRWFYVPFADPEPHLRVRFNGNKANKLRERVLPRVLRLIAELQPEAAQRVQVDSYDQELERYGGPEGMNLAEDIFCADSNAACQLLALCTKNAELRWQLAVLGIEHLFRDFGFDLAQRATLAREARDRFGREIAADGSTWKELGIRHRRHARQLEAMLWSTATGATEPIASALYILQQRSHPVRQAWAQLRNGTRVGSGRACDVELAYSFAHLHATRMLGVDARSSEPGLYDFLRRQCEGRLARKEKRGHHDTD